MICPRCAKRNSDENDFCFYCEAKLIVESSDMDDSDTFETIGKKEEPVRNRVMKAREKLVIKKVDVKRNNLIVMIGCLLLLSTILYFSLF